MGVSQSSYVYPPTYYPETPEPAEADQLRMLLFSDTHMNVTQMTRFAAWYAQSSPKYDLVIMPGDFANIAVEEHSDPVKELQAEQNVLSTLEFVKKCIGKPIVYIPGNHEPNKMYTREITVPGTVNLHKGAMKLATGLVAVGMGGSLPALIQKEGRWVTAWSGYPYTSEEAYTRDLVGTFESAHRTFGDADYLLLTHVGPWDSATAIAYMPEGTVYSGSKGMSTLLGTYVNNILADIHGHTHESEGRIKQLGPRQDIINPGAITSHKFGELVLVRGTNGRWAIGSVKFYDLI